MRLHTMQIIENKKNPGKYRGLDFNCGAGGIRTLVQTR